jgi:hypothetical protein
MQHLQAELKNDRDELIRNLTAKCEAAQDKIKENFEVKINSEMVIVNEKINDVRRDQEVEISKLSSALDEVNTNVNDKINSEMTRVKEYVDDKCRQVPGAMLLARKNAEAISQVNNKLGELQRELADRHSGNSQSADVGRDGRQAGTSSRADTAVLPNISGNNGSCSSACHDGGNTVSQTVNSAVNSDVNVMSEGFNRGVDWSELTLPSFTNSSTQVPLHFIHDLDLHFKLKQIPDCLKLPLTFRSIQEPIAKQ